MNDETLGKIMTIVFVSMALIIFGYFIYQAHHGIVNLWIFMSGGCLWMLAVANAKINELIYKKPHVPDLGAAPKS